MVTRASVARAGAPMIPLSCRVSLRQQSEWQAQRKNTCLAVGAASGRAIAVVSPTVVILGHIVYD